ncbi:restriction endonuclease subunit S [Enterococcus faecalis]
MKKVPRLRFRGFSEDWELCKLSGVIEKLSGGASIKPTDYLEDGIRTIPKGAVNATGIADLSGSKYISEDFFEKNITSHVHTNNLVTSLRDLVPSAPNMGRIVRIEGDEEQFLMPQGVYKLELFEGMDGDFLISFSNSDKYRKIISAEKNGSTQVHIRNGEFLNIDINLPSKYEQKKIGAFFKQLDNTITLHQRKLDQLKNLKNAYLQLMFVSNGPENSTVPKLRFANFTEEWELCGFFDTIEDTIDFRGRTPKKLGLDWSDNGYLALSALNVKHGYIDSNIDAHYGNQELYDKWMSGKELRKGQVLFTTEAPMGNVAQIPDNTGYILSQRTIAFETKKNRITDDFLAVLLGSPKIFNELSSLSSGGTAKGISQKSLSQLRIQIPCSISEQKEIGIFFKQLNETITLHQNKLDQLKDLKKSYLQNMFI